MAPWTVPRRREERDVTEGDGEWRRQFRESATSVEGLRRYLPVSDVAAEGIHTAEAGFAWRVTPYYAGLVDPRDPACPIRLQAVPDPREADDPVGTPDSLDEQSRSPAPNLVQVYPDRVAWLISSTCPVLCRHCQRKWLVGRERRDLSASARAATLKHIRETPAIRDVLLTGGDPLMHEDGYLDEILSGLRSIPHVEVVRIGTRAPCTLPHRITPELCAMLRRHHPVWVNTQFNHPRELTPEARQACERLVDAGIPVGNQSVLLRGVNDDPEVMRELVHGLVRIRVRPYYLFQAQTVAGTAHLRTSIERGMQIMASLRGHTSGIAVPRYVLDTPYGKVSLEPDGIVRRTDDAVWVRSFDGRIWREPNPREGAAT
jgi:lysine 2,3-aminomutase